VPYLGDFGIALLSGHSRVTSANEIVGTPAYLAPEQVYGGRLGPAVDVYALGLVLLECLTGRREFTGTNKMKAALARLDRAPQIPTDLPTPLAVLLRAMTAVEPHHRPTAEHCVRTLGGLMYDILAAPEHQDEPEDDTVPVRRSSVVSVGSGRHAAVHAESALTQETVRHRRPTATPQG
jgi:serine/threonine protein kinase